MICKYLSEDIVDKARAMFDEIKAKDQALWNAMKAEWTKNGMHTAALPLFQDMMISPTRPNNDATLGFFSFGFGIWFLLKIKIGIKPLIF